MVRSSGVCKKRVLRPNLDGQPYAKDERIRATKHLKQEHHIESAIIACTADTTEEATQAFLAYGACEVIYKPIKKEQLSAAIQRALNKDKTEKAS